MKRKRTRMSFHEVVPIVSDALFASRVAEGKGLPLLILDTREHPELEAAIAVHKDMPPGDVDIGWAGSPDERSIILQLHFLHPVAARASLIFPVAEKGILVDSILHARALYLQAGKPGDRLRSTMSAPRLLVGVAAVGFDEEWERIFLQQMTNHFHRQGLARSASLHAARHMIDETRRISRLRVPQSEA